MNMKRHRTFFAYTLVAILISFSLAACGKEKPDETVTSAVTAVPTASLSSVTVAPIVNATVSDNSTLTAEAVVGQTTAYYFPDMNGSPNFYAAFEIQNIGKTPIYLKEATISFHYNDATTAQPFTPVQSEDDVLLPGKTQAYAIWYPTTKIEGVNQTIPINASIEITTAVANTSQVVRTLPTSNLHLIQNYPSFPTLTGAISNPADQRDFSMYMLYAAFYDKDDKLIGVWNSTEPINMLSGTRRNFVNYIHMLPIPDLANNTVRIEGRSIGFE